MDTSSDGGRHQEIRADAAAGGKLIFDRVGAWHIDPDNSGVVNQYAARPGVIDVFAPITMAPNGVCRFGAHGFGCRDCNEAGPFGSYD